MVSIVLVIVGLVAAMVGIAASAPIVVVGWCLLAVFVSRGRSAAWLSAGRDGGG